VDVENREMEEVAATMEAVARDIARWFVNMDAARKWRKKEEEEGEERDSAHREADRVRFMVSNRV
jgi:hypothetical protein